MPTKKSATKKSASDLAYRLETLERENAVLRQKISEILNFGLPVTKLRQLEEKNKQLEEKNKQLEERVNDIFERLRGKSVSKKNTYRRYDDDDDDWYS